VGDAFVAYQTQVSDRRRFAIWRAARGRTRHSLERSSTQSVRPFLARYCIGCHGGSTPAAQFDLRPYSAVSEVVRDYPRWTQVMERLSVQEMPPKQAPQPPSGARQMVIDWVHAVRLNEARCSRNRRAPALAQQMSGRCGQKENESLEK